MANKVLGRATIKSDGLTLLTKRGSTLNPGGDKRTAVVGTGGVHGFSTESVAPDLALKITQTPDITVDVIGAIEDATIVWEGDDKVSYVLTGAFCTDTPELNEVEGEITAKFSATSCQRI